ncbi:MAG: L-histidine N(alpha)-methyltransferase [Aquihabitans sp.]
MSTIDDHPVEVYLQADEWKAARAADVRRGLAADPPELSPVWFYDDRGSVLFDEITRLPEYYQTRAERQLLQDHAWDLMELGIETLVELGSGTSDKTVEILKALDFTGALRTYAPFDVSEVTLREAIAKLAIQFPDLAFRGIVGDFHRHLGRIPRSGPTLVAFLGGTIGNFRPAERARFLDDLAAVLDEDDRLLVGIDLVKDQAKIVAAYDDARGVTAAFNRNALVAIDRELSADFDPLDFDHVARWNDEERWIEMRLRARCPVHATIPALDVVVDLREGEDLLTEISAKFAPDDFAAELAAHGFAIEHTWISEGDEFGLVLARRTVLTR